MKQPFFKEILPSISSTDFYHDQQRSSFFDAIKYLYLLCATLILITLGAFVLGYIGKVPSFEPRLAEFGKTVRSLYPEGLTITYNNGSIKTNVDEPFSIDAPTSWGLKGMHLVTIDTAANASDISKYKTLVLVTKHAVVYPDKDNGYRIQVFEDKKGYYVISSQTYRKLIDAITPYLDFVVPVIYTLTFFLIILGPLLGGAVYVVSLIIYLIFAVIPAFIVAKIGGIRVTYGSLYVYSLRALTLSLLFQTAKSLGSFDVPFSFFVPYFIWIIIIAFSFKSTDAVTSTSSKS